MKVNLKSQGLTIDDIQMERIYVGSEKYLFYFTTIYVDNQIKEENLRYVCVRMNNASGNLMFNTKEELWQAVCKFSLRKANFELTEI